MLFVRKCHGKTIFGFYKETFCEQFFQEWFINLKKKNVSTKKKEPFVEGKGCIDIDVKDSSWNHQC